MRNRRVVYLVWTALLLTLHSFSAFSQTVTANIGVL